MRTTIETGEEQVFRDREIHFGDSIYANGRLIYENCRIFCCENGSGAGITLGEDGEAEFRNCELICCGTADSAQGTRLYFFVNGDNGTLKLTDCRIRDFRHLAGGIFGDLEITGCEFTDCSCRLLDTDTDCKGSITDCRFSCTKLPGFVREFLDGGANYLGETTLIKGWFDIEGSSFDMADDLGLHCFDLDDASSITDCEFRNICDLPAALCNGPVTCYRCQLDA